MISSRLQSIASLIDADDKIIDIACDHALLDIYLVKEKKIKDIIVSDILNSALNNAKKNIKKYNLEKYITPILSDGLQNINTENKNTIIISGLGTKSIIGILRNIDKHKSINKLVIQANNDHYYLRSFIVKKKFYIENEVVVKDNNKEYITIVFKKGKKRYSYKELMFGPILIKEKSNINYFLNLLKNLELINNKIPKFTYGKKYLSKKIKILKNILKKLQRI